MNEYYIQDETEKLNKRVDDAFTELDVQRNRMSGLTKENAELKHEINMLKIRIDKTDNFIGFMTVTYLIAAIAKLIAVLII